jgi:streptogramin lyase
MGLHSSVIPTATLGLVSYTGKVSAIDFKTDIDIKSIAYDSSGSLWYAGCDGVGRLTRSHAVRDYLVEGGCNGSAGVSVGRGGLAWFSAGGHIGYVDASDTIWVCGTTKIVRIT